MHRQAAAINTGKTYKRPSKQTRPREKSRSFMMKRWHADYPLPKTCPKLATVPLRRSKSWKFCSCLTGNMTQGWMLLSWISSRMMLSKAQGRVSLQLTIKSLADWTPKRTGFSAAPVGFSVNAWLEHLRGQVIHDVKSPSAVILYIHASCPIKMLGRNWLLYKGE